VKRLLLAWLLSGTIASNAYVLNTDGAGNFLHWNLFSSTFGVSTNVINLNSHAVRYFLASDAYSTTNTAAELNAVRAVFAQWMTVSNSYLKFEEGGMVSPPVDVNSGDNMNVVFWTKSSTLVNGGLDDIAGSLGVTFTTWQLPDMSLKHADIVFNGVNYTWFTDISDPTTTKQLVDGVALHEIGHFLGLNHSPLGGATMFWRGAGGVNPQTGLHSDDFAGIRFIYPTNASNYGAIKGTVLKEGAAVLGAVVMVYDSFSNAFAGTLSHADGQYELNKLPPASYQLRVTPLDDYVQNRLCAGWDVDQEYGSADTVLLTSSNASTLVSANVTNTINFNVPNAAPALRLSYIRKPSKVSGNYSWSSTPIELQAGQSNYFIGMGAPSWTTNGATLMISGNGLTIGTPTFAAFATPAVFVSVPISVASNATAGSRDLTVSQGGESFTAPGYFTVLPTVTDDNFDGLDDSFQRTYFSPFTSANAAPGADPDGDNFSNNAEFLSGTVPTNSASFLKILNLTPAPGGTTVRWLGTPGKRFQLAIRTNLTSATWTNVGGIQTTTNYFDNTATIGSRFYRVQVLP